MLLLVTATTCTLSGCMGMAWAMDKMHSFILLREEDYIVLRQLRLHKGKFHHKLLFILKNLHQRAV